MLGLRMPEALLQTPLFECHAASWLTGALKKRLYGYKFYNEQHHVQLLSQLLIEYWHTCPPHMKPHPENVLVTSIPPHEGSPSRLHPLARCFARHFDYDYRPDALRWQRPVTPQHTLLQKTERFKNLVGSLETVPLSGYSTLIILDDLTTSGATFNEAARALRASIPSTATITALAIAKVPLSTS